MDFATIFKRERHYVYLIVAISVICCSSILSPLIYGRASILYYALIAAIAFVSLWLIVKKHRVKSDDQAALDAPEEEWQRLFDRYTRRSINWLFAAFWNVFSLLLSVIVLGVNSKAAEIADCLSGHLFSLELFAFFLAKNLLILRWLKKHHDYEKEPAFRKEFLLVLFGSLIYWALAIALFIVFERVFVLNVSVFVTAVYVALTVLINLLRVRRFTYFHGKYTRIVVAVILVAALLLGGYQYLSRDIWLTQPYINATPHLYESECRITYDDATGIYTVIKPDGDFRILQLTDIHLGGGVLSYDKDKKALEAVNALLEYTKPDLVIVTGDLCFPVGYASFSFNNTAPVQQFAAFMRNTGIPWAFTYGNHDTESYAASSENSLNELYKSLSWKTSRTLMYPYVQPDIMGRNNQLIELRNADGSLNQGLFLIDSNAYTGEGLNKYDYIHDDQVDWYRDEVLRMSEEAGHTVPSMVFFHIPLQQYRTAYQLYEQGSDQVIWYFGENNEEMMDKVCCSDYPSSMFDVARELGSTTGFFCGHDHYNNMSLEYEGIRLTYGMSIDYLAMPGIARDTAQRGATLITIHDDGSTEIEQVPLSSVVLGS